MREIIFDRKNYKTYKDFYTQIYKDLDGKNTIDWEDCEDLHYFADHLNEFLWYQHDESIKYIFINFDRDEVKLQRNYDDYEYNLVFEVFEDFVKDYPNNQLEIRKD